MTFNIELFMELSQDRCDGKRLVARRNIAGDDVGEALMTLVLGYSNEIGRTRDGGFIYWVDTSGKPDPINRVSYAVVRVKGE